MEGRRDERTVSIRASCRPLLERRQRAGPGFGSVAWVLVVVIYPEQWLSVVGRCTASGCGFGLALARGAPPFLGRGLAAEADDGVVVVAVGLRSVTASGVVGVTVGVFLGCPGPAVAVAPERHLSTRRKPLLGSPALAVISCSVAGAGGRSRSVSAERTGRSTSTPRLARVAAASSRHYADRSTQRRTGSSRDRSCLGVTADLAGTDRVQRDEFGSVDESHVQKPMQTGRRSP